MVMTTHTTLGRHRACKQCLACSKCSVNISCHYCCCNPSSGARLSRAVVWSSGQGPRWVEMATHASGWPGAAGGRCPSRYTGGR